MNQNEFIFEVDGETYVASEGQVTEFLTAEEVTTTPIDDDDDKKKKETTIIIVVVVVVVVVLLIILATGVYVSICIKFLGYYFSTASPHL